MIPVYNEAPNVGPLVDEIDAALRSLLDYEIVIVDDGSSDSGQGKAWTGTGGRRPRLIRHEVNRGQSAAILTGVKYARAPWVATIDGDGQNDPADIVRLLRARDAHSRHDGPLLVVGYRFKRRDNLVRRWSSRIANAVRGRLLKDRSPDTGCGLKLFERDAFLSLPRFDHMHRFLPALFQRAGIEVVTVEVHSRPRLHGHSKYGVFDRLWVGIVDLFGVMWLRRRNIQSDGVEVEP